MSEKTYILTIYNSSAEKTVRRTEHKTRAAALKSRDAYERRHGRAPHSISVYADGPIRGTSNRWTGY
jgi:hypothetical protein